MNVMEKTVILDFFEYKYIGWQPRMAGNI